MRTNKRVFSLLTLLVLSLISSCASESDYSQRDVIFAEMMIPHHEQAIEMSDLALTNSSNPEILSLAETIKAAQEPEIAQMKSWDGVDAKAYMGHSMAGMLDDEEIEKLKAASGSQFDRLFLEGMIKHHEGAIEMAQDVEDSKNPEVANLAREIIEAQKAEIDQMKELLNSLG